MRAFEMCCITIACVLAAAGRSRRLSYASKIYNVPSGFAKWSLALRAAGTLHGTVLQF